LRRGHWRAPAARLSFQPVGIALPRSLLPVAAGVERSHRKPAMNRSILPVLACWPLLYAAAASAQTTVPPAGATPGTGKTGNVAEMKQRALSKIQERLSRLQAEQSCVNAAQDMNALHACREQAQAGHEKKC
jgi:hypothetical protein